MINYYFLIILVILLVLLICSLLLCMCSCSYDVLLYFVSYLPSLFNMLLLSLLCVS